VKASYCMRHDIAGIVSQRFIVAQCRSESGEPRAVLHIPQSDGSFRIYYILMERGFDYEGTYLTAG
jgi:hypothetical protein